MSRQAATPAAKLSAVMLKNIDKQTIDGDEKSKPELTKGGAVNYVVAPRALENQRRKHQKTDRLDARALLENLESYLRGNRDAMSIVAVPSLLQEQQRSVVRYREQLVRNRRRAEARGRALALTQ